MEPALDRRKLDLLRKRSQLLRELRVFLEERGFWEVETPLACAAPCIEPTLHPPVVRLGGRELYLATSPEFHMKRLIAAGAGNIFQVTRAFRDGERGRLHAPEFTIVEWYRVEHTYQALMQDLEALLIRLCARVGREPPTKPFKVSAFRNLFERLGEGDALRLDSEERLSVFVDRVEPWISLDGPEFVVDYPADMASLALVRGGLARRFELYAAGMELANGFDEITDPQEFLDRYNHYQEQRLAQGLEAQPVDLNYLRILREGLPPCCGVAVGFDRLVMYVLGAKDISDVMAFPLEQA